MAGVAQGCTALTLPLLRSDTRYNGLPRRYEETRPVLVQSLSHRYVIELGERLQRASVDRAEQEKAAAVRSAEEVLWARAEALRQEALEKALNKAKLSHERELKKIYRQHDKQLKDELSRLEAALRLEAQEQVRVEREAGERRFRDAVAGAEKRAEQVRVRDVEQARQDERAQCATDIENLKQSHATELEAREKDWRASQSAALAALRAELERARELAVAVARHEEQTRAEEGLARAAATHESAVRVLRGHVSELQGEVSSWKRRLELAHAHTGRVMDELMTTRQAFQAFIDDVRPYEPGTSEYVIPPLRVERTESVLEIELHRKHKE